MKDGDRRIFVQSDIGTLIALRDTDKPLDDTAKDLVYQHKERLEVSDKTEIAIPGTYENSLQEMNVQLTNDMSLLKTTVSRLQQDHHFINSSIGNSNV